MRNVIAKDTSQRKPFLGTRIDIGQYYISLFTEKLLRHNNNRYNV